jgi:hypothetical protein
VNDHLVTLMLLLEKKTQQNTILHHGETLSLYLFTLVMDEITKDIQDGIPWYMFFVDDVILLDETRTGVDQKL